MEEEEKIFQALEVEWREHTLFAPFSFKDSYTDCIKTTHHSFMTCELK